MAATAESDPKVTEYRLKQEEELRFDVGSGGDVVLELCEGTAEIFGSELVLHRRYAFPTGCRIAVFTWHGCALEVIGPTEGAYVAPTTPMVIYVNTHAAFELMRKQAENNGTRGPTVMIVGPTDVGKSTYCKILCNYAARQGRSPVFVDLDVGQGSVSVPGTIGALFIERPADPVEGFDKKAPLVLEYGHLSPGDNVSLYNQLVRRLAEITAQKCSQCPSANSSGIIINTCGWVKGSGYSCLVSAATSFEVDIVIVIDHERLYNELQRDLPHFVKIVHEPKSGGVEERSREQRIAQRRSKIRQYFYGTSRASFYPHSFELRFSEVSIFKIGAPNLPDSLLPLGMKQEDSSMKLVPVQPSNSLAHHILAISMCESTEEKIIETNVAGFICILEVHMDRQSFTVLSPQPYPLPRSILLLSEITFME